MKGQNLPWSLRTDLVAGTPCFVHLLPHRRVRTDVLVVGYAVCIVVLLGFGTPNFVNNLAGRCAKTGIEVVFYAVVIGILLRG